MLFATAVLLNQPFELFDAVDHMNAFASVEPSWLQDPDILPRKMAHWHD